MLRSEILKYGKSAWAMKEYCAVGKKENKNQTVTCLTKLGDGSDILPDLSGKIYSQRYGKSYGAS